jgi:hypothetical protein
MEVTTPLREGHREAVYHFGGLAAEFSAPSGKRSNSRCLTNHKIARRRIGEAHFAGLASS